MSLTGLAVYWAYPVDLNFLPSRAEHWAILLSDILPSWVRSANDTLLFVLLLALRERGCPKCYLGCTGL